MNIFLRSTFYIVILFASLLFLSQCNKSDISTIPDVKEVNKDNFTVSMQEATEVAQRYILAQNQKNNTSSAKIAATLEVTGQETIVDSIDKKPLFHIINLKKGFTIVSADIRTMPILAYSEQNQFDTKDIPKGVLLWMESAKVKIRDVRKRNLEGGDIIGKEWKKYFSDKNGRIMDTNCYEWYQYGQFQCQNRQTTFGPLLTTHWGQKNISTAELSTSKNCDGCGRMLAGCGPVAMAQVDEFYHPSTRPRYSNTSCTVSTPEQTSLALLMKKMGTYAQSQYDYAFSCNTFTWPGDVKTGFSMLGYSNGGGTDEAYSFQKIKNDLTGNHPVIFWGSTCLTCLSDYHIWVCDGLQQNHYSEFNCSTKQCNEWTYTYLHMNWGWSGSYDDWYSFGAYNPGGQDYNGNLHVITGIRP
ncbi:Spi protease inhibitor [Dyadobacter koreensis]|uniref:Spi protease inhibitor n=1 Tax=Dyadobacter koreensis TaxID=408657 RepID=A0A1H6SQC2_9BACT|nr:Spi family protease inhibitor [Dyadobacter koreensis]SEI70043.1 Spi protease inhibitor [Dyadobacter koreensis]